MRKKSNSRFDSLIKNKFNSKSKRSNSVFDSLLRAVVPSSKTSQAAMEFLMTYGWAIMAAVLAIAVLAYFGVFNPNRHVSSTVYIDPPFFVKEWKAGTNDLVLRLQNTQSAEYLIVSMKVSGCGGLNDGIPFRAGGEKFVVVECGTPLPEGKPFKGDIEIIYKPAGGYFYMKSIGEIVEGPIINLGDCIYNTPENWLSAGCGYDACWKFSGYLRAEINLLDPPYPDPNHCPPYKMRCACGAVCGDVCT